MRTLPLLQGRLDGALPLGIAIVAAVAVAPLVGWAIAEENWRLLVLISLVALAPIVLRWPVTVGFGAYAFLVPFDSVALVAESGGATLTKLVGIGAAGALLLTGVTQRRLVRPPLVALWVALFFLWALMSLAWALDMDMTRARIPTALSLLAMYLVAVSYGVSPSELRTVCWLTMLGGALAAAGGVVLGFEADAAARGTLSVAGREANPNAVAQSLLLSLAMAVGIFLASAKAWSRTVAIIATAAIAAGIFLTMSRGALLAVGVMTCVLLYRFRLRWRILLVVGVFAALLPLMPDLFFARVDRVLTGEDATGSGRTEIWEVGVHALERFGVLGAGLSNFPAVYTTYAYTPPRMLARGAHNTYIMTWVELGAVGLTLLLAAMVGHLRAGKRRGVTSNAALAAAIEAACFGFLVIAFFSDFLWAKAFWMPWILMVWVSRPRMEELGRQATG